MRLRLLGYGFWPGAELIGQAAGDEVGRMPPRLYHSPFPRLLQLLLGNLITRAGGLRRQMCLLWSLVLIG